MSQVNRFRLDNIADLARQLEFSPTASRLSQLASAETLILELVPEQTYPLDYIVFRLTGFQRKAVHSASGNPDLLTGMALQHDLGVLIEEVSATLDLQASESREPVLSIDDVTEKFNVTSKTIQRWRKRGLASRKFTFTDGKKRVGFLLSSVERFVRLNSDQVVRGANFTQVSEFERDEIIRNARRLAEDCLCCVREITRRLARRYSRSPLTILHTIRKHDQDQPKNAILARAPEELSTQVRQNLADAAAQGTSLRLLAHKTCRTSSAVYRVILDQRIERLSAVRIKFIEDELYHTPDTLNLLESMVNSGELSGPLSGPLSGKHEPVRVPKGLPAYLAELYRVPLLTPAKERALFLLFNYHKFRFVTSRRELDPEVALRRDLDRMDAELMNVREVKNQITQANLRLVVSVARKHMQPGINLMELVSEGNITLMRAIESFDTKKGVRFSTYATLALMKGFARSVPELRLGRMSARHATRTSARASSVTGSEAGLQAPAKQLTSISPFRSRLFDSTEIDVADLRSDAPMRSVADREQVEQLLSVLPERDRAALRSRFGLDGGDESVTPSVRRLSEAALDKLRASLHQSAAHADADFESEMILP